MNPETVSPSRVRSSTTTIAWLIVGWLWVGIPLSWGVTQTVLKSLALFEAPPATVAPTAAPVK